MYYRVWGFLRVLIILAAFAAILGAVAFRISEDDYNSMATLYALQVTVDVGTAVADALNNATRTAEAPMKQYRLVVVQADESLDAVAERYQTTGNLIRVVNGLAASVTNGNGSALIIPEGVIAFDPPRRLLVHRARFGDTLAALALQNNIPLRILEEDNPVLAGREVLPGDVVFIAELL